MDEILSQLEHSDEDARAAALAAADQARLHLPKDVPHDQAATGETAGGESDGGAGNESGQQREAGNDGGSAGVAPSVDELFAGSGRPPTSPVVSPKQRPQRAVPITTRAREQRRSTLMLRSREETIPDMRQRSRRIRDRTLR